MNAYFIKSKVITSRFKRKLNLALILFTLFIAGIWFSKTCLAAEAAASTAASSKKQEPVSITISAAGDCTLGVDSRYNNTFNDYYQKKGASYFLKKVKPIFSKDDLTIVNFEGTLTSSGSRVQKKFTFKGPAGYASILTKGSVEVVNLANNHSMDYGQTGFTDTKRTLKRKKYAIATIQTSHTKL